MSLVFLDRDGVINRFPGKGLYVTRKSDFVFLPGARRAIALLTRAGHEIAVISNQGGVCRGLLTKKELQSMTKRMLAAVEESGGKIQRVHYCLHQSADKCGCKKPKLGLIREAVKGRRGLLKNSFFVGDSEEDMEVAYRSGARAVLVLSGRTKKEDLPGNKFALETVKRNLLEAARWILKKTS